MSTFRLLLLFILGYFIFRIVKNALTPRAKKSNYYRSTEDRRQEGDVTIDTRQTKNKKKIDKEDGDYVDFEEL